ncbi:MAG: TonB-dependent receptor [Bacteroidales bacterium]|nr:TonB-dependent receptor [Bacteroidales bacterium]
MRSEFLKRFRILLLVFMCLPAVLYGQEREITGTVTDEQGVTLPGVTVTVEGTTRGTSTDMDGKYTISVSPGEELEFSFVGMNPETVIIEDQTVIDVTLSSAVEQLDEVVVVGYGVQKKETVAGAVSQVSGDKLMDVKMGGSIENSLQGNLPGLVVVMQDPTPGEEANSITMQIRGGASMGNNSPLILVDGVERSFSNLDPNEIASISILKDASATAVYGVKGANGVILVNTKRGRKGAVQLDFSATTSIKSPTRLPEYMNSYETLKLRNEAYKNDGMWDRLISDEALEHYRLQDAPYLYPDFDWMDFYFGSAVDQNYNLNARGGNDFVQYFVSVGYLTEGDVFQVGDVFPYDYDRQNASYWHKRYTFRNNLDFNLTKTTELAINMGGYLKVWNKPEDYYTQETWFESVTTMPYYPEDAVDKYPDNVIPYDQDGIRPFIRPDQGQVRLMWLGGRGFHRMKSNEVTSDVDLKQDLDFITEGLSASVGYSYTGNVQYRQIFFLSDYMAYNLNPADSTWTRYDFNGNVNYDKPQPKLDVSNDESLQGTFRSHYYNAQLNYDRSFGNHNVSAIGLFSRRQAQYSANFPSYEENWVGRATYNYDGRYLFEASVAHTGSEKFAPGLRFGTFPSFSAGWVLSEEDFFRQAVPWANYFKVRASWGKVGSDAGIARWLYLSEYTNTGGAQGFGYPMNWYPFISEGAIPVTDATWEEAIKRNIGIETGFFRNLITLNVDVYNESRVGILQSRRSVPSWVGVSSIMGNLGETKAHGIEIDLGVNKTFANGMFFRLHGILSANESRVVFFDESPTVPENLKAEGKPVGLAQRMNYYTPTMGIQNTGFYQDFEELFMYPLASGPQPIVGDFRYLDYNGDGVVNSQDRVVSTHPFVPELTWSGSIEVGYKSLSLRADLYGISSAQFPMRQGGMFYLYPFTQNKDNAYELHADHWTPDNRDPLYPAVHHLATNQYNYQINSFSILEARYTRLRNLSLNYQISNNNVLRTIGAESATFTVTGSNLFTWTPFFLGGDPEGFNMGVDFGAYPMMKRFNFEIRVTF